MPQGPEDCDRAPADSALPRWSGWDTGGCTHDGGDAWRTGVQNDLGHDQQTAHQLPACTQVVCRIFFSLIDSVLGFVP